MNFLVVEDDEKIGSFIARGLQEEGHHVDWIKTGDEGFAVAREARHDAIVMDLMLPGRDGMSVIRQLRQERIGTPILVLSARSSVDDRVTGLSGGADDYLTKPFSFAELVARLQALVRRASSTPHCRWICSLGAPPVVTRRSTYKQRNLHCSSICYAIRSGSSARP